VTYRCDEEFNEEELIDIFHVMPLFGREHECSTDCWCNPKMEFENPDTGAQVWSHVVLH